MAIIDKSSPIWKAIDLGGGQGGDVAGVLREIKSAGFLIVSANTETDAQRWRALMGSARMHYIGSGAGITIAGKPGTEGRAIQDCVALLQPGKSWHFGLEFWSQHPAIGTDSFERALITDYADAMRALRGEG